MLPDIVSESYITHIRVTEDAISPSSPPDLKSPESNKKPRVIVVAVRKTGRVRMHKARENANGTFSVGKTWNLDDLTAIQSYTNAVPVTAEQQEDKQRAGGVGFIVTITKPYYWQAATAKEKEFFIFSLIKIYKKYTGGKLPDLFGFDPQELESFAGAAGPPPGLQNRTARPVNSSAAEPGNSMPTIPLPRSAQPPSRAQPSPQLPFQPSLQAQGPPRQRPPPAGERSQSRGHEPRPQVPPDRPSQERQQFRDPSHERGMRTDSEERMPYMPGSFPSTSQPQLTSKRSESPALRNQALFPQDPDNRGFHGNSGADSSQNQSYRVLHSARPSDERARQNANLHIVPGPEISMQPRSRAPSNDSLPRSFRTPGPPSSRPSQESLMERGRPPLNEARSNASMLKTIASQPSTDFSKSITSSDRSREPSLDQPRRSNDTSRTGLIPPTFKTSTSNDSRSSEDPRPPTTNKALDSKEVSSPGSSDINNTDPVSATPATSSIPTPPETPTDSHRPGLGPMIKAKRSNKEIASKFRNAATAYSSFKPRAGGAAEKFREQTSPTGEPDGITSVVPAPSLVRPQLHQQDSSTSIPDQPPSQKLPLEKEIPVVTVESPPSNPLASLETRPPAQDLSSQPPSSDGAATQRLSASAKSQEEHRRKRKSDHSAIYAKVLGVDQGILAGRTSDIESTLNDFGWGEDRIGRCSYDDLQANLQKDLARAETGGWLAAVEHNDDRILALGGMMDRVIAECEELDGLLTLYGVELSVSQSLGRRCPVINSCRP